MASRRNAALKLFDRCCLMSSSSIARDASIGAADASTISHLVSLLHAAGEWGRAQAVATLRPTSETSDVRVFVPIRQSVRRERESAQRTMCAMLEAGDVIACKEAAESLRGLLNGPETNELLNSITSQLRKKRSAARHLDILLRIGDDVVRNCRDSSALDINALSGYTNACEEFGRQVDPVVTETIVCESSRRGADWRLSIQLLDKARRVVRPSMRMVRAVLHSLSSRQWDVASSLAVVLTQQRVMLDDNCMQRVAELRGSNRWVDAFDVLRLPSYRPTSPALESLLQWKSLHASSWTTALHVALAAREYRFQNAYACGVAVARSGQWERSLTFLSQAGLAGGRPEWRSSETIGLLVATFLANNCNIECYHFLHAIGECTGDALSMWVAATIVSGAKCVALSSSACDASRVVYYSAVLCTAVRENVVERSGFASLLSSHSSRVRCSHDVSRSLGMHAKGLDETRESSLLVAVSRFADRSAFFKGMLL